MSYGNTVVLNDTTVDAAVERVTAALAAEGFGILTTIDVKATLKKKIDVDFRPYRILGACNPRLAHRALSFDAAVGLLLPCNVIVHEIEGGAEVQIIDPMAMFAAVDGQGLDDVVGEATERLGRVATALAAH